MPELQKNIILDKVNMLNDCWIWKQCLDKDGYGVSKYNKKYITAHRLSYMVFVGHIPSNMFVCHTCDNPPCVNPDHLYLGTAKDNARDRTDRKRYNCQKGDNHWSRRMPDLVPKAEKHFWSKFDWDIVRKIREMKNTIEISNRKLAKLFNMSSQNVCDIVNMKIWRE